jgi:hypothetical protein
MRNRIMKRMSAVLAAAGLAVLLAGPAWAASSPLPASGTFFGTSETVDSVQVADGNTIMVFTLSGILTGTFDGPFTETDRAVIHPDGSATEQAKGVLSGKLGTCGTGSVPYTGLLEFIAQAASTSTPMKIHSVDTFTVNTATGEATYTGTYHCT